MSLQYYALSYNSIQSDNLFNTKTPVSPSSSSSLSSYVHKISGAWSLLSLHLSYQTHTITKPESFINIFCYVCKLNSLVGLMMISSLTGFSMKKNLFFLLFCFRFLIFPREQNKKTEWWLCLYVLSVPTREIYFIIINVSLPLHSFYFLVLPSIV